MPSDLPPHREATARRLRSNNRPLPEGNYLDATLVKAWYGGLRYRTWVAASLLLPSLALAGTIQMTPLRILTPDEFLRTLGFQISAGEVSGRAQNILQDIEARFRQSRGMELVQYVEKDTGINLIALVRNILTISAYLFVQIFAIISDIASKLAAP
ncbi:MAG: hypothetical protein HYT39_00375 [Candidatus Sungbacteria bacterium]|nr:hypothetical protein [Candidatus Sungbacteria bacterium]